MRRTMLAVAVGGLVLSGLVGCMQGKYIEKHEDWGIVGVKSQEDKAHAAEMIRKHVGADYAIVEEYDPRMAGSNGFNPSAGVQPNKPPAQDGLGWYVKYAKKTSAVAQLPGSRGLPGGRPATSNGLPVPDMNGIQQAGFRQFAQPTPGAMQPGAMQPGAMQPAVGVPQYTGAPIAGTGMPLTQTGSQMPTNPRTPITQTMPAASSMIAPAQPIPGQTVGQYSPYGN